MLLLVVKYFSSSGQVKQWLMMALLIAEVLGINAIIGLNGGASNPFNAVLLVPVIIAFMQLNTGAAWGVLVLSIAAQLSQLLLLPAAEHHHDVAMEPHYYAMIGSFVFTGVLVALLIQYFRHQLSLSRSEIQQLRERQLRDEQLLAIGTAAAQLTHDVATPAQSIRLLIEEAHEEGMSPHWLDQLSDSFFRIDEHLGNWRQVADDIREHKEHIYTSQGVWQALQKLMSVARPETVITWCKDKSCIERIQADNTLFPAITNILINACEAAGEDASSPVTVEESCAGDYWQLLIKNRALHIDVQRLSRLGIQCVRSEKGHGLGAMLSNASIEKFGGTVSWQLEDTLLITTIRLPTIL